MDRPSPSRPAVGPRPRLQGFQKLMPYRMREVLLVASRYDSFIIEEEGQLTDIILQEYERMNLNYAPRLHSTPSAEEAIKMLGTDRRYDMVIVTMHPGEMDPADFAREVRRLYPSKPIVLLGYDNRELQELLQSEDASAFDNVFVWTGDARILLAIVKLIEDQRNVEHDTNAIGVDVILFVEDSVHFASSYLPMLYTELMKQSQRLLSEGITLSHKVMRMRARPKILLASNFEQAWSAYEKYRRNILGVISDVRYPYHGAVDAEAGFTFAELVLDDNPDVPILLQSTEGKNGTRALDMGIGFMHKHSPTIRQDLEQFMLHSFGFGPFVFQTPEGERVGEAHNLRELRHCLMGVPEDSLRYHAERNHFSAWLKARTEFSLAARLRPQRISDYETIDDLRRDVVEALDEYRKDSYRDTISEFDPRTFGPLSNFAYIGGGSLGGKARGLAFLNTLIREKDIGAEHEDIDVCIPPTVVVATDVFDRFMYTNGLTDFVNEEAPDETIRKTFLMGRLPRDVVGHLRRLLEIMTYPCAVRSSSLLEDSQHQPFAGVYETYMLPNAAEDLDDRLRELCDAIKLVYASTFSAGARGYLQATPQRPEKEKMAVIIQKLVGHWHHDRFYPSFAGVAQSYNYYPFGDISSTDGAAHVGLGLGKTIVEGRGGLRFCPKFPEKLPQMSRIDDILRYSQKEFAALQRVCDEEDPHLRNQPREMPIADALNDGTLGPIASIYSHENHAVYDGIARTGAPVITFAGILKHNMFPLSELLIELTESGTQAMITPVEIEFAVDMAGPVEENRTFACLQMRPLAVMRDISRIDLDSIADDHLVCQSPRALGHGRIREIRDVLCVVPSRFDRKNSLLTAGQVGELNARMCKEQRPFLLIGPGRWGSADPWLGIPVNWSQIAGARIIVETGFEDTTVTPSDGSHFFHNIIAFQVAYMTTNPQRGDGFVDCDWLLEQEIIEELDTGLCWIRLPHPIVGLVDGVTQTGVIVKREADVPRSR